LYLDDTLILTGREQVIWRSFRRRINSTISTIRQHDAEPHVERGTEEDANLVQVSWDEATKGELHCLELPSDSWRALEGLAESTGSFAKSGPHTGKSSWCTLIRRIANSEFTLQPSEAAGKK